MIYKLTHSRGSILKEVIECTPFKFLKEAAFFFFHFFSLNNGTQPLYLIGRVCVCT